MYFCLLWGMCTRFLDTQFTLCICRKLSQAAQMQAIGHQVVGSESQSHEDVKLMYEKFFGTEAVSIKRVLKKRFGPLQTRQLLSQIFQVYGLMSKLYD